MRFLFQSLIWLTLLVCALAAPRFADCQEASGPEAAPQQKESVQAVPAPASPGIDASMPAGPVEEPPIYYLRDQQGRLVPMLGFTYEEFMEFFQQKQSKTATPKPSGYSLGQLTISGQMRAEHAELTAEYKIQLGASDTVEIPLVSGGAVLLEPATYDGAGDHELRFDAKNGGYFLRLHGNERSEHVITLKLMVPVKTTGSQHQLQMTVPSAAASKLSMHVAMAAVELTGHTGTAAAEAAKASDGGSNLTLWGIGGPITLAWNDAVSGTHPSIVLEANGKVLAHVDRRNVEFDARLSVRSLGGSFDRFHVALPAGAKLIAGAPAEAEYVLNAKDEGAQQIVEVQLPRKTVGPVELRLHAESFYDAAGERDSSSILQLAGFEVKEAAPYRQFGHIAIVATGDRQPTWDKLANVRQTADLPDELRRKDVVAGFEYFELPASLAIRMAPRKTRISIEPEYFYYVESNQLRLEAKLNYVIRGASASALEISLPGWEIDEVGPADRVNIDPEARNRGQTFTLPLAQTTSGPFELTLKAHLPLKPGSTKVEFAPPTFPSADSVAPALVVIVPADNIRIHPRDDELVGLIRPMVPPRIKLPVREQPPLVYRGEQAQSVFAGNLERLSLSTSAAIESKIELMRDTIRIDQEFHLTVEHESTSSLVFDVPSDMQTAAQLDFQFDGQSLAPITLSADHSSSESSRVEIRLPSPQFGRFDVALHVKIPRSVADASGGESLSIPLAMPSAAALESNRLAVSGELASNVQPEDEAWMIVDEAFDPSNGNRPMLRLSAAQATPRLTLRMRSASTAALGTTTIHRAWIQTWIAATTRQDRAVYRISSSADVLEFSLPRGASPNEMELRVDQEWLKPSIVRHADEPPTIRVPLREGGKTHLLEMRYQFADYSAQAEIDEFEFPKFVGASWIPRMYWQLIVPRSEHLWESGTDLTPEFVWNWTGLGWERRATLEQPELEKWIGATASDPPSDATNRYLFSVSGNSAKFSARTVARWKLVLAASAILLVCGLLLIHIEALRRTWILFAGGVLAAAVTAWNADAMLMVVQSSILGLGLFGLGALLGRIAIRRRPNRRTSLGVGSSVLEHSSGKSRGRSTELAGASTRTSGPLQLPATNSPSG